MNTLESNRTDEVGRENEFGGFEYKTVPHWLCVEILLAYQSKGSLAAAYYAEVRPLSWATFGRVVKQASALGLIEMQPQGGSPEKLKRAKEIATRYPLGAGYSREEQASMAGCSVNTIYRAAPDKRKVKEVFVR